MTHASVSAALAEALDTIARVVGDVHVVTDPELNAGAVRDWTGRFVGWTPAVVRPGTCQEVADVLRICRDRRVAVVPQGGNTGLVGGSVPLSGELVVQTSRLRRIGAVDPMTLQVTAQAGVTLSELQRHAAEAGLAFGVDFGSRESATVGGILATNAGGLRVLRYGTARAQVVGTEAAFADGTIRSNLEGHAKDNAGYDIDGLLCGSEGTLAIITAARLRLIAQRANATVALVAVDSVRTAVAVVAHLKARLPELEVAELIGGRAMELVEAELGPSPVHGRGQQFLLFEACGSTSPTEALGDALQAAGCDHASVSEGGPSARRLWDYRERITEVIARRGVPVKLDVAVNPDSMPALLDELSCLDERWDVIVFGHVADGNLHINVVGPAEDAHRMEASVYTAVIAVGGSAIAEHGVGTAKREWAARGRPACELHIHRALKRSLDDRNILNPRVMLPEPEEVEH